VLFSIASVIDAVNPFFFLTIIETQSVEIPFSLNFVMTPITFSCNSRPVSNPFIPDSAARMSGTLKMEQTLHNM
jgi:hypothetical protein